MSLTANHAGRWLRLVTAALLSTVAVQGTMAVAAQDIDPVAVPRADAAPLTTAAASPDVLRMAEWVLARQDNGGLAFVIVDKRNAAVFAFDAAGTLRGSAPALLGLARGDVNPPGIGDRPLSAIGPEDRITAAGRFVARLGNDLGKADILWVDYAAGLSLHRVVLGKPADQRLRRLASPTIVDNRISYGCVNVPADFFDTVVRPLFIATTGIVYILPEIRSMDDVFPTFGAE